MLRAYKDLRGQMALWAPREKEVPLVSQEPLGMTGQQALQELWVHRELQDPEGPQDSRGTEVLLEKKEPKVTVDFQIALH